MSSDSKALLEKLRAINAKKSPQPGSPPESPSTEEFGTILERRLGRKIDYEAMNKRAELMVDQSTGEARPSYANGMTPEAALNKSPLSAIDRLKLSFSDDVGRELAQRFPDGTQQDQNGDWLVKSSETGGWHRVDPVNYGDKDPWELAKDVVTGKASFGSALEQSDIVGDMADVGEEAALMTASVIAGLATGGSSLVAQAAAGGAAGLAGKFGTTSLGRFMGTYEASAEDQVKDIALESVLNAGGAAIAPGVSKIAGRTLNAVGRGLSGLPEGSIKAVKALGKLAGLQEDVINWTMKQRPGTAAALDVINKSGKAAADVGGERMLVAAEALAAEGQPALNTAWKRMEKTLLTKAAQNGQNAAFSTSHIVVPAIKEGLDSKLLHLVGKQANGVPQRLSNKQLTAAYKQLTTTGSLPEGIKVAARSIDEVRQLAREGEALFDLVDSPEVYEKATKALLNMWNTYGRAPALTGAKGMQTALRATQALKNSTWELRTAAEEKGQRALQALASKIGTQADEAMSSMADNVGAKVDYKTLNGMHSKAKEDFGLLLNLAKRTKNGDAGAAAQLSAKLSTAPGKNLAEKGSVEELINFTKQYAPEHAETIIKHHNEYMDYRTAVATNPWLRSGLLGSAGGSQVLGGMVSGQGVLVGTGAATLATSSPRIGSSIVRALVGEEQSARTLIRKVASSPGAKQSLLALRKGSQMAGKQAQNFFKNPAYITPFITRIGDQMVAEDQANDLISQSINQRLAE